MKNLISVIVPVYKVEKYLHKCVDSIINQTYKNLEIILVDDGSPDNCPQICDEYAKKDSRVKVVHKQNGGVSSARNVGLENATGEFIAFVDSDDWLELTMYEKLMQKQMQNFADLVFCRFNTVVSDNVIKINENDLSNFCLTNDIKYFLNVSSNKVNDQGIENIKEKVLPSIWRCIFKKDLFVSVKFDTNIIYMEDLLFLINILNKNNNIKIDYVDEYLYYYLIRNDSVCHDKSNNMIQRGIDILENNINLISQVEKIFETDKLKDYLLALKFYCYCECYTSKYINNADIDLNKIDSWKNKKNYSLYKKLCVNFKYKLKAFLIYHNINFLLKILYKIK